MGKTTAHSEQGARKTAPCRPGSHAQRAARSPVAPRAAAMKRQQGDGGGDETKNMKRRRR
eukprot:9929861-Lingulodinium_polyedra.AAC.1